MEDEDRRMFSSPGPGATALFNILSLHGDDGGGLYFGGI